ncbi:MAG: SUF system Fe-S cluster assembly protein [Burkholderiales bacterium]|nr:MAG: SUF system Fe-S cluster assembly protein [Burkholderiales bacterium]
MPDTAAPAEGDAKPSTIPQDELDTITDSLIQELKKVYDPEIPVDIYELGLIYKVDINDDRHVDIEMTLTAPACPVAGEMPGWVEDAARKVEGVRSAKATIVFDPPWDPSRMSDEARLALNML